ncbi:MAG: manganese efflux pump MntP family protein, partial [Herbinix sp.]|nr:manganese efflux pump MntP family protein [Herbinix sp.]
LITQILLGFCLATDAFAVSITNGMCSYRVTKKDVLTTALTFGLFQGIMPILGFLLGNRFTDVISKYQHFIALFLLGAIGINMIIEAIKDTKNPEGVCKTKNVFTSKNLIIQGIATSIDALAAGVSLAAMDANITSTALLIGGITFICCLFGVFIGRKFGLLLGIRAKFGGGIILIILGFKLFIENIL